MSNEKVLDVDTKRHNPILNGSTKKIVFTSTFLLFLLTSGCIIGETLFILQSVGTPLTIASLIGGHTSLGTGTISGIGSLAACISKYMDTRDATEKAKCKIDLINAKALNKLNLLNAKKDLKMLIR